MRARSCLDSCMRSSASSSTLGKVCKQGGGGEQGAGCMVNQQGGLTAAALLPRTLLTTDARL